MYLFAVCQDLYVYFTISYVKIAFAGSSNFIFWKPRLFSGLQELIPADMESRGMMRLNSENMNYGTNGKPIDDKALEPTVLGGN
jgi:hypothetical protein